MLGVTGKIQFGRSNSLTSCVQLQARQQQALQEAVVVVVQTVRQPGCELMQLEACWHACQVRSTQDAILRDQLTQTDCHVHTYALKSNLPQCIRLCICASAQSFLSS